MVHENIVIESERKEGCAKYKLVNGVFLVETLSRSSAVGLEKVRFASVLVEHRKAVLRCL